jgi:hypothetical protein
MPNEKDYPSLFYRFQNPSEKPSGIVGYLSCRDKTAKANPTTTIPWTSNPKVSERVCYFYAESG